MELSAPRVGLKGPGRSLAEVGPIVLLRARVGEAITPRFLRGCRPALALDTVAPPARPIEVVVVVPCPALAKRLEVIHVEVLLASRQSLADHTVGAASGKVLPQERHSPAVSAYPPHSGRRAMSRHPR